MRLYNNCILVKDPHGAFVLGHAYHLINISKISKTSSIRGRRNTRQKSGNSSLIMIFASVRVAKAENSAGLKKAEKKKGKEKKSILRGIRLSVCTYAVLVHRHRMELFVGYSRRVEDEWF